MRYAIILISIAFSGLAQGQTALSIDDAIEKALSNNLNIKVSENTLLIAQQNHTKGNAGMLPTVTAGGSYNASLTNTKLVFAGGNPPIDQEGAQSATLSGNVTASYTLFNGFTASHTYAKLGLQTDLAAAQQKVRTEAILLQVVQAYYQALQIQNNLQVASKSLAISQQRFSRAKLRVEFGSANKIEMLNAQVDLQNDSINVTTLAQQLTNAKSTLGYLMGNENAVDIELISAVTLDEPLLLEDLLEKAKSQNSELNQARIQEKVSAKDVELSNTYLYPRLAASAAYQYSSNESDASFIIENRSNGLNGNVSLSYNLFDGRKNTIRKQNAQIGLENALLQTSDVQRLLSTQVENAFLTYQNGVSVYELRKNALKVNELNFQRSQELYKVGQITGTDFREAQLNLLSAEIQMNLAIISARLAEFELLRLSGELVK